MGSVQPEFCSNVTQEEKVKDNKIMLKHGVNKMASYMGDFTGKGCLSPFSYLCHTKCKISARATAPQ